MITKRWKLFTLDILKNRLAGVLKSESLNQENWRNKMLWSSRTMPFLVPFYERRKLKKVSQVTLINFNLLPSHLWKLFIKYISLLFLLLASFRKMITKKTQISSRQQKFYALPEDVSDSEVGSFSCWKFCITFYWHYIETLEDSINCNFSCSSKWNKKILSFPLPRRKLFLSRVIKDERMRQ